MKIFKPFPGLVGAFEGKHPSEEFKKLENLSLLKQVHGDRIHVFKNSAGSRETLEEGDALLSSDPNISIAVKTADCVPILLAHPQGLVGAVHAGWRGTRLKILEKTLFKIRDELRLDLQALHLAIGPAICAACYEVGEEVAKEFAVKYVKPHKKGKYLLDLKAANADLALEAGILASHIEVLPDCTLCQNQDYYSYRHESQHGLAKEGRNFSWMRMEK